MVLLRARKISYGYVPSRTGRLRMDRIRMPIILIVLTALMVTACAGAASSPRAGAPSTASSLPDATTRVIASTAPSLTFTWPGGSTPTVTPAIAGIDAKYVNPGAVIASGGTLHMFANVFSIWPGPMEIAHLTSTDGATWAV